MLKRANARMTIFETDDDYAAFERILAQAVERFEIQLLYYCDIQPLASGRLTLVKMVYSPASLVG